ETVGCQMNVLDSELVVAALRQQGYELCEDPFAADTVLFNTCSVRELAEHKTYSSVGRLKRGRRSRPQQVIGLIGCMAQKDQGLIFDKAPHVDLVVGTGQLAEIPKLVDEVRRTRKKQLAVSLGRRDGSRDEVAGSFESYDPLRDASMRPSPWQAYVRIMIGCDKFCTYCVVPTTRGPEQSRPPRDILREVQLLADQGVREITLLGQTVNSYKHTQDGQLYRLSDLLQLIHDVDGILRIKFVTNFPKDMTDDLLQAMSELPKVARYLHVPLQAGCDDVLKQMKRGYTTDDYRDMMTRIRKHLPDCAVSSDFIVGFCGESEESFQKTMQSVAEYRFKNSFIFKYSPRPGTKAFELYADDIPEEVKKRRNNELLALQTKISEEDNAAFIGQEVEVLVEGLSKRAGKALDAAPLPGWHDGAGVGDTSDEEQLIELSGADHMQGPVLQLTGRTRCDRIVVFDGNPRLAGSLAQIAIHDVTPTTLIGSIVTQHVQPGLLEMLPIVE
ncbi:MAG: tRNA (N6-isopentenyl adenosine(37)-C2)-methylthiotransferase MiaB, partial [Planctomycetaceae bacterium]|nr:tRNA (N6-isopentenyl adenosine(37)-C2)-methylthiotransferase MiaB [Planctomycetaceae bacterium]